MYYRNMIRSLLLPALLFVSSCSNEKDQNSDESAIREKINAFTEAYNQKDPQKLAALWSENGEYIDPETGLSYQGREEIQEQYKVIFEKRSDSKLNLKIDNISFPTSQEAVETGVAEVTQPGSEPNRSAYKAYYTKVNGQWLLKEVREVDFDFPQSNYEKLKDLEWLVGEWIDQNQDTSIVTIGEWDKYKNFITQHFTVTAEGQIELEGKQILAWDPIKKRIRSWVFDSDGGFGEGVWRKEGDAWVVESAQTLIDGRRASSINTYRLTSPDTYTWESTGREVGGEFLPNINPVTAKRVKAGGKS